MHHFGALDNGASLWLHTFAIPWLRPVNKPIQLPSCIRNHEECGQLVKFFEDISKFRNESLMRINNNTAQFQTLINTTVTGPLSKPTARTRRFAPFSFIDK
jgi:hypothetical protein